MRYPAPGIVWGGYEYKEGPHKGERGIERSFVVMNYKRGTREPYTKIDHLDKFGRKLCRDYNQETYLLKLPGRDGVALYKDAKGRVKSKFVQGRVTQAIDAYFTSLSRDPENYGTKKSYTLHPDVVKEAATPTYNRKLYFAIPPRSITEVRETSRWSELFIDREDVA